MELELHKLQKEERVSGQLWAVCQLVCQLITGISITTLPVQSVTCSHWWGVHSTYHNTVYLKITHVYNIWRDTSHYKMLFSNYYIMSLQPCNNVKCNNPWEQLIPLKISLQAVRALTSKSDRWQLKCLVNFHPVWESIQRDSIYSLYSTNSSFLLFSLASASKYHPESDTDWQIQCSTFSSFRYLFSDHETALSDKTESAEANWWWIFSLPGALFNKKDSAWWRSHSRLLLKH